MRWFELRLAGASGRCTTAGAPRRNARTGGRPLQPAVGWSRLWRSPCPRPVDRLGTQTRQSRGRGDLGPCRGRWSGGRFVTDEYRNVLMCDPVGPLRCADRGCFVRDVSGRVPPAGPVMDRRRNHPGRSVRFARRGVGDGPMDRENGEKGPISRFCGPERMGSWRFWPARGLCGLVRHAFGLPVSPPQAQLRPQHPSRLIRCRRGMRPEHGGAHARHHPPESPGP